MNEWRKIYEDNFKAVFWTTIVVAVLFTLRRQYIMDDAFISFRYAHNLIDGHGLVWNLGERVEGYSNFSWVMLVAGWMWFGIMPETSTYVMGIVLHFFCLLLTYRIAFKVLDNRDWAMVVLILFAMNFTVSGMATSGLETPLQLLLFLSVAYIFTHAVSDGWNSKRMLLLSIVLNLAMLTRPDSIVLVGMATAELYFTNKNWNIRNIAYFIIPFLLILLPFLIWKQSYYGSIIPNSFNAKVHGMSGIGYGLFYIYLFSLTYFCLPHMLMVAWKGKALWNDNRIIGYFALFSLVWIMYIVYVGGDFMDFRFMVVIIPLLLIMIIEVIRRYITDSKIRVALVVLLLLGTPHYNFGFKRVVAGFGVEKVSELADHVDQPPQYWDKIGRRLKEIFGGTDVVLGVGPAGVIPYRSELPCIDLIGLTDPEIPNIAESFSVVPGHRIISPMSYLYKRKVNLIIQPVTLMIDRRQFKAWAQNASWGQIYRFYLNVDNPGDGRIINEATLLGIPIDDDYILVTWYLTPHEDVERAIARYNLQRIRLVRR